MSIKITVKDGCRHCSDVNPKLVVCDYCIEHLYDKKPIESDDLEYHIKSCWDISGHLEAALRILNDKINNQ
jgi:hypothetical protein